MKQRSLLALSLVLGALGALGATGQAHAAWAQGNLAGVKVMAWTTSPGDSNVYLTVTNMADCTEAKIASSRPNFDNMLSVALAAHLSGRKVLLGYSQTDSTAKKCDVYSISIL